MEKKSEFGIIGLGVMGTSLARNISRNGYRLSMFNRHVDKTEEDIAIKKKQKYQELSTTLCFDNLERFVQSLSTPRSIMLMVNAGNPVDQVLHELKRLVEPGDLIIDGGNSHYKDTQRRFEDLKESGILYLGCGVSGGEKGALNGPSIMPGGSDIGYLNVKDIFENIAATSPNGSKCSNFIGIGGSGHFVKMVHNGIEYAEMQLLAELYSILREIKNLDVDKIADVFEQWAKSGLNSYLLEITIAILREKNDNEELVLDSILDKAGNKGTGSWTTIAACELGVPIPSLTAALFARYHSSFKSEREENSTLFESPKTDQNIDIEVEKLKHLYQFSRIMNHHQGIELIKAASVEYHWNINIDNLLDVWSAGCIIRSELLMEIKEANSNLDFLRHEKMFNFINKYSPQIVRSCALLNNSRQALPCLSASVDYYKSLILKDSNANMIQAQRDYFGAHKFQLKNDPTGNFVHYIWENN